MGNNIRSIDKLYELVLPNIEESLGICTCINYLYSDDLITFEEWRALRNNFRKNKPKWYKHIKFFLHEDFCGGNGHWWSVDSAGDKQRVEFIKYLIEKHK